MYIDDCDLVMTALLNEAECSTSYKNSKVTCAPAMGNSLGFVVDGPQPKVFAVYSDTRNQKLMPKLYGCATSHTYIS